MRSERNVGGLLCSQVLVLLSQYVDGDLTTAEQKQVETHVGACGECARFGSEFGAMVAAVRSRMAEPTPDDVVERLTLATLAAVGGKR